MVSYEMGAARLLVPPAIPKRKPLSLRKRRVHVKWRYH